MVGCGGKQRIFVLMFGALFVVACSIDTGPKSAATYLIRVGENILTLQDFDDAFEIAKIAYSHNAIQDSAVAQRARWRLLNQLADEMVILARAEVLNISLTDMEIEAAIDAVKGDYPEGMFEETLLESAISFSSWKGRLKIRLLTEKVVEQDLTQRVDITQGDVISYYGIGSPNGAGGPDPNGEDSKPVDKASVDYMRRTKAEAVYHEWMTALKQTHRLDVNQQLWKEISDRQGMASR